MKNVFKTIGTVIVWIIIFVCGFFTGCSWLCEKTNKVLAEYGIRTKYSKPSKYEIYKMDNVTPIFDNKCDADSVLTQMHNILNNYGSVSVLDMYDLSGLKGDYKDAKYGWTDLSGAKVNSTRIDCIGKYYIQLPDAIRFDN